MLNSDNDFLKSITDSDEEDNRIFEPSYLSGFSDFYKNDETAKVWWIENSEYIGRHLFSFDKKKIYNLFADYPHNMTKEEVEIFNKENPYWREFFADRF